ncbi:hypothetical protein COCVIDRAFT_108580 [Bipolaris victoriae FI3]|uniref:Uncharacterized protein n=1 Tax=Bipolaris victoriae (strain FI3) TaxID=930091 RepID=W7EH07_BIPV3|nr:hypothetical protein COCVIDRAFT_108580 [Bipolaris victoriae FI3]
MYNPALSYYAGPWAPPPPGFYPAHRVQGPQQPPTNQPSTNNVSTAAQQDSASAHAAVNAPRNDKPSAEAKQPDPDQSAVAQAPMNGHENQVPALTFDIMVSLSGVLWFEQCS